MQNLPAFRLGPVYRGQFGEVLSFLRPTVHTVFSNAPTFRGQSRLSAFGCVLDHSATTFGACAHLMKTAVRYSDINYGPKVALPSPDPTCLVGPWWDHREKSQVSVHPMGLPGKVPLSGTSPANGTQSERGVRVQLEE